MTTRERKGRRLTRDEHALWTGVTRSIAPLRPHAVTADAGGEPDVIATPQLTISKKPDALTPVKSKAPAMPPLAPLERRMKQRLKRGRESIDARLDLHGHTQAEAYERLLRFLRGAQAKDAGVVLVITGKGVRGDGERGVLKRQVPMWLGQAEFRDYVVGFDDASVAHGGTGALYVRMRRKRHTI